MTDNKLNTLNIIYNSDKTYTQLMLLVSYGQLDFTTLVLLLTIKNLYKNVGPEFNNIPSL